MFRGEAVIVSGEAAIEIVDFDCSFTTKTKKPLWHAGYF